MKRYLLFTLLIGLAVIMLLSSCTKTSTTTSTSTSTSTETTTAIMTTSSTVTTTSVSSQVSTASKSGGTWRLITAALAPPALGNPWEVGTEYYLMRPVLEPVLNFDNEANVIPWLATDFKYSPDSLTLTLTVRQGVKFHDGTDLDATTLKWNMDHYVAAMRSEYASVSSIEAPDKNTVLVKFTQPDSGFLFHLALSCLVISPTAYEANGGPDGSRWKPVGTGPFKLTGFEQSVKFVTTKYDGYWQKGKPYLDGIEVICIGDPTVAVASFLAGEADTLIDQRAVIDPKQLASKQGEFYVTTSPDGVISMVGDSAHADSPFSNLKVRQALSYAIDTESIVEALGQGFWRNTNQFSDTRGQNYNPEVVGYPYNPQAAKDLLAEAGYTSGLDVTFTLMGDFLPQGTAIQGQLAEAGINVDFNVVQGPQFMEIMLSKGWNNGITHCPMNVQMVTDLVANMRQTFSSDANFFKTSLMHVDAVDDKINKAVSEVDLNKRTIIIHDLQKLLIDEYCIGTPVIEMVQKCFSYNTVKDSNLYDSLGSWVWSPENTWLSK